MKRLLILLVLLGLLPLVAYAQDGGGVIDLNGEYDLVGANMDGSEPYTGTGTYTGIGSVYMSNIEYSYEEGLYNDPFLLIGNVLIDAYGAEACSDSSYSRLPTGALMGLWIDPTTGNGIGAEFLSPTAATTDFVGSYTIQGIYPNGTFYEGSVTINKGDNDLYTLDFTYPPDTVNAESLVTQASGLAVGNILGFSSSLSNTIDPAECAIFVGQVAPDKSHSGIWYEDGALGTETATPK